jgi:hypothetical protein
MKTKRNARYLLSVFVLLATMSLGVCIAEDQSSDDPSQDPIYLKLKAKDVNEMTPREYDIFKQKEAAVTQYRMTKKSSDAMTKTLDNARTMTWIYVAIPVVVLLILVH